MRQEIRSLLEKSLLQVAKEEGYSLSACPDFGIEKPKDPSHGDWSSNLAMLLAKTFQISPRSLAEKILAACPKHKNIAQISIAGPGFINIHLKNEYLAHSLEEMWQSDHLGVQAISDYPVLVVDYSSPNLAKEMHVGHLRSSIIGDALARILEFKGWQVVRQNHVGDWGTQFGMLIAHFADQEREHAQDCELSDLEQFYKAAKARFDEDQIFAERARQWVVLLQSGDENCLKMWSKFIHLSLAHCQAVYQRLGVTLKPSDVRAESAYNDDLPKLVSDLDAAGLLTENEGAKCVFLDEFKGKNDEPLPLIVQKKDGGFLYASTDLAAIRYRQQVLHAKRVLYVVDIRQALHFQQVFAVAKRAGFADEAMQLEHISFGMVLDKSGRPFKSREGGVTKLADLLDEAEKRAAYLIEGKNTKWSSKEELERLIQVIAISSVKYADLSKNRSSDYIFDWDAMISFEGNTAPYLLYAYTRIQSIFQKAGMTLTEIKADFTFENSHDEQLAKQLLGFADVIDMVAEKAAPHYLCTYLYELAGIFSSWYEASPILNATEETKASRLKLAALAARVLKTGLNLLGIEVVTKM